MIRPPNPAKDGRADRQNLKDVLAVLVVTDNMPIIHRNHTSLQRIDNPLIVSREYYGRSHIVDLLQNLNDVVGITGSRLPVGSSAISTSG